MSSYAIGSSIMSKASNNYDDPARRALNSRITISTLVAEDVGLEKEGDAWRGECPSHPDRERGLHVSDEAGAYVCFSCGRQGDAIDWVMKTRTVSEDQAFVILAKISTAKNNKST